MPIGRKPTVFISSTCYDLKQIRTDIKDFFEGQLEYDILLSEYSTFPLDPNVGTLDNCLRVVNERADIFVLVVGCRYGSVTETGHSITNITDDDFNGLATSFSKMCEATLCDIERFSKDFIEMVRQIPDHMPENASQISLQITLTLSEPNTDDFNRELRKIQQKFGI